MKTAIRKAAALLLSAAILFTFCGCDFFALDTADLLNPPEPSGDISKILASLNKSVTGEYDLVYPNSGEYRSPIIEEDIDGDGLFESIAFYSLKNEERPTVHMNIIVKNDGKWISVDDIGIEAGGVESVEFCDLDGNGKNEILVGWEIYTASERQLAVYSFDNNSLLQLMLQRYTSFLCCDIDENGMQEIFLQDLNTTDGTNRAMLSSIDKNGVLQMGGCTLDSTVKSAYAPTVSKLASGQPAIYIDEVKGVGAITEVLYFESGELINGLLDTSEEPFINKQTLRASSVMCRDADGDGVPEIPIEADVPNADSASNEKITYVNWCVYTGTELQTVSTSIINTVDGYMIDVPNKWKSRIAILKDTEKHQRTVYAFNPKTQTIGEKIITFKAIGISEFKSDSPYLELMRTPESVICAVETDYRGELKLTKEELTGMVKPF